MSGTDASAADVLARVAETYARCRSYRDRGAVTIIMNHEHDRPDIRPFSTRFVRPDRFAFEFSSEFYGETTRFAVWLASGATKLWETVQPHLETLESLELGLAAGTGISGGSAYRVPTLLMPQFASSPLAHPMARIVSSPEASQYNCVVVERPLKRTGVEHWWIDRDSWLVRRVVQPRRTLPPMDDADIARVAASGTALSAAEIERFRSMRTVVEYITEYEAEIDVDIPAAELEFTPP